jgi:membrane protein DedA with SNARE-associated domain
MGETGLLQYVLVFFGSMVEGDATLLTAAFLAHSGKLNFIGVLLTAGLASTILNEAVYHLSRTRSRLYFERKIAQHPKYAKVQHWIRRRSVLLLLFSRYAFGFRLAIPAACGMTGMNPILFFIVNAIGAAIWVIPLGYAGYAFGGALARFWSGLHQYEWHIAVAALAVGWILLVRYDPELHMVAALFFRTRSFAITESARLRHLLRRSKWRRHVEQSACDHEEV